MQKTGEWELGELGWAVGEWAVAGPLVDRHWIRVCGEQVSISEVGWADESLPELEPGRGGLSELGLAGEWG
ncbi:MAG: hypothetical protein AB4050_14260, partial [Synechococcus sp.]